MILRMVPTDIGVEKLQGNIFLGYVDAVVLDILESRGVELG